METETNNIIEYPQLLDHKMGKIKNKHYRNLIAGGLMNMVNEEHIVKALKNIKGIRGRHIDEGKALLIALYYTGARPKEVLMMKAKDFSREGSRLRIIVPGSKGGRMRYNVLPYNTKDMVQLLYKYTQTLLPNQLCFYHYITKYKRLVKLKDGTIRERFDLSDKLRYHMYKWFDNVFEDGIPPYYLRHNRTTKMLNMNVVPNTVRLWRGSRSMESLNFYAHQNTEELKKIARRID